VGRCDQKSRRSFRVNKILNKQTGKLTMSLNKIGLRINTDFQRVEKKWIERARKIQISNVGDVCFRLQGEGCGGTVGGFRYER
jgi:hypothetical protein